MSLSINYLMLLLTTCCFTVTIDKGEQNKLLKRDNITIAAHIFLEALQPLQQMAAQDQQQCKWTSNNDLSDVRMMVAAHEGFRKLCLLHAVDSETYRTIVGIYQAEINTQNPCTGLELLCEPETFLYYVHKSMVLIVGGATSTLTLQLLHCKSYVVLPKLLHFTIQIPAASYIDSTDVQDHLILIRQHPFSVPQDGADRVISTPLVVDTFKELCVTCHKDREANKMCLIIYTSGDTWHTEIKCGRKHHISNPLLMNVNEQYSKSLSCFGINDMLTMIKRTSEHQLKIFELQFGKVNEDAVHVIVTSSLNHLVDYSLHFLTELVYDLHDFVVSTILALLYFISLGVSLIKCIQIPSCLELYCFGLRIDSYEEQKANVDDIAFYESFNFSCTRECVEEHSECVVISYISIVRSQDNKQAKKEVNKNLQAGIVPFTEEKLAGSSSQSHVPPQSSTTNTSTKHLPPSLEAATPGLGATNDSLTGQHQVGGLTEATGYITSSLPGATVSHSQHYGADFDKDQPLSREERRKDVQVVPKEKDVDTILESHHKDEARKKLSSELQATAKPSPKPRTSANVDKPPRFPRKACVVYKNEQYSLDPKLLSLPRATKYLVKVRTEISPGRFMAKLELHCASQDEKLPNLDVTATTSNEQIVPVRERKHFRSNIDKTGYVIFSSDLESFSGHIQYPLPNKRATASRIGYGGNAIVFVVFHAGKEFAVKKTVYRSKEISVHSQLCHPNIINLEAVLVGEKHERHRDKYYVYCFMQKMDINFRNVLSTKDHGCLKHLKMKLVEKRDQWETVLLNVKHVLRSVLKALDYMHGQGLVHRDVKASNILIKTTCQCSEVLYCSCQHKFIVQLGDFDSSATVPGYQLHLEEHQMIRYASVLPLGTMGYRAPEVSMHLVLSGPYEVLYTTGVDIWSFGCLLLAIFIGKSGPLKQRGEASLLLSAQDHLYSQELYHKIIKISELRKYYANVPGACDLAEKCLQVQPHCRPTAKELLQLDFFR